MLRITDRKSKKWISKRIVLGMTLGILAGSYGAVLPVMADGVPTFTKPIVGDAPTDRRNFPGHVDDTTYTFADGLNLQLAGRNSYEKVVAITANGKGININAKGQPITVAVVSPAGDMTGIFELGNYYSVGKNTVNIDAKTLNVQINKSVPGLLNVVNGIEILGKGSYYEDMNIKGDLNIEASAAGSSKVYGIVLHELSNIDVTGNVNIDVKNAGSNKGPSLGDGGVRRPGMPDPIRHHRPSFLNPETNVGGMNHYGSGAPLLGLGGSSTVAGIFISPQARNAGDKVNIHGNLTIKSSDKGIYDAKGFSSAGYSGNITVEGGANIDAASQAINIERGHVTINSSGNSNVNIKGDIVGQSLGKGDPGNEEETLWGGSSTTLTFSTPTSTLEGEAFMGDNANLNLVLKNGATWTNQMIEKAAPQGENSTALKSIVTSLDGGEDASHAGYIVQKSTDPLTVKNFSGHAVLFFPHTGDPTLDKSYTSGDVTIEAAAKDSNILVQTDNEGVSTSDLTALNKTLNALAKKLVYANYQKGERNLTASVGIADGLTASSRVTNVAPIDFSKSGNGGGVAVDVSRIQNHENNPNKYTVQIYEENYRAANIQKFWDDAGIRTVSGNTVTYNFNGDTTINVLDTDKSTSTVHQYDPRSGAIVWATDKDGVIDMNNHSLTAVAGKSSNYITDSKDMSGVYISSGTVTMKNITGLNVRVHNTFLPSGIEVNGEKSLGKFFSGNGEARLIVQNDDKPEHAVNIAIDDAYGTARGYDGYGAAIEVDGNSSGVAEFKADGLVNFNMTDKQYGIFAMQKGIVDIGGGTMKALGGNYLIYSNGNVKINADHSDTRPVDMVGDIYMSKNGGNVSIALTNSKDTYQGAIFNDGNNNATMTLQVDHGGVFTNESQLDKTDTGKNLDPDMQTSIKGTHISRFIGSDQDSDTGFVYQNDKKPITIDQYQGITELFYNHANDGTDKSDFTAGDTIIRNASPNSKINLRTSNKGIDLNNVDSVNKVLSNLAYKLVYNGSYNNANNLQGTVGIVDGLTASDITKVTAPIAYDSESHGITAGVKKVTSKTEPTVNPGTTPTVNPGTTPTVNPVTPPKVNSKQDTGNVNTGSNTQDSHLVPNPSASNQPLVRVGDYENPIIRGVRSMMMSPALTWRSYADDMSGLYADGWWAKVNAGKTKYTNNPMQIDTDYHLLQVGYTHLGKKNTYGASVMYHKGDTTGYHESYGKDTMLAADLYASYVLPKQQRFDVSLKVGRLSQDIHAMNSLGILKVDGTYKGTMTSLAAKYSKRLGSEASYVDPEVEFTYSHMPSANFTMLANDNTTMQVVQGGMHSLVGSVGITAGKMLNHGHVYAGLHLKHDFAGDGQSIFKAADGGVKTVNYSIGDTWTDMTVGGDYRLADGGCIYGQVNRGLSGHFKKHWQLQAGISLKF